jgi:hypothetical protein
MIPESKMAVAKAPLQPYTTLIPKSLDERLVPETEVDEPKIFKIVEETRAIKLVKGSVTFLTMKPLVSRIKKKTSASPKRI